MALSLPPSCLRADARRNQRTILQAAARLLADDPAASMQAIADAAAVSRPTVYRRFPNRDALLDAIRAAVLEEATSLMEEAAASPALAVDALGELIRGLSAVAERYPVMMDLFRMGKEARHPPQDAPELRAAFERLVERGRADGSLRDDVASATLRRVVFGGLVASLRFAQADGIPASEVGAQVAEIVLGGVRAPTGAARR